MAKNKQSKVSAVFTSPRWAYVGSFFLSVILIWLAFRFQNRLEHFRSLGLFGIFLINFFASATIFFPVPGIASVVAGGYLYPPLLVGFIAALGASFGDMTSYILGRAGTHIVLSPEEHKTYLTFKNIFHRFAGIITFFFAFIPNPVFDAIGILAGITEYSPIKFLGIMFAGRLIRNIILALIGARL